MNSDFRNRVVLPILVPLGVLLGIAALVIAFAFILLYNTKEAALVLAAVTAAGILAATALASSRDRLDSARKGVLLLAGAVPVLLGAAFALGLGGVDDSLLNINREPHGVAAGAAGRALANENGCVGCHAFEGPTLVGPTWAGIWGAEITLNDGTTVVADREYIATSIREPDAFAREGFQTGVMPAFDLSEQEIDALVELFQSLSENTVDGESGEGGEG